MARWIVDGGEFWSLLCKFLMKTLNGDGGSFASKDRL